MQRHRPSFQQGGHRRTLIEEGPYKADMAGEAQRLGQLFKRILMQFLGVESEGQQDPQFQCATQLVVTLGHFKGMTQGPEFTEVALGNAQTLAGRQHHARLLPIVELLG
ncbi:hypothetical protein D3C79_909430 [compost metagenome]